MKRLELHRIPTTGPVTSGVLVYSGLPIGVTLELPWKDNVKEISCIPKGIYICKAWRSPRFGDVFMVDHVPDRAAILIHAGNSAADTRGCILPGLAFEVIEMGSTITPKVSSSMAAMQRLKNIFGREAFTLDVR
jgi:hypothetical protein